MRLSCERTSYYAFERDDFFAKCRKLYAGWHGWVTYDRQRPLLDRRHGHERRDCRPALRHGYNHGKSFLSYLRDGFFSGCGYCSLRRFNASRYLERRESGIFRRYRNHAGSEWRNRNFFASTGGRNERHDYRLMAESDD